MNFRKQTFDRPLVILCIHLPNALEQHIHLILFSNCKSRDFRRDSQSGDQDGPSREHLTVDYVGNVLKPPPGLRVSFKIAPTWVRPIQISQTISLSKFENMFFSINNFELSIFGPASNITSMKPAF